MGYTGGTMGRRVWAIVRALSGRNARRAFSNHLSPLYLCPSLSIYLPFSLCLSSSLSLRLFLFSILHLEPASSLHYFIIFKHVTFLARLRSLSLSLFYLPLSLSFSLGVAVRDAAKKHVGNRNGARPGPLRRY